MTLFEKAAFYGGTCLRIFYGLERFSEDMDFSLLKPSTEFSLIPYFEAISTEFEALGLEVEITSKNKLQKNKHRICIFKANYPYFQH